MHEITRDGTALDCLFISPDSPMRAAWDVSVLWYVQCKIGAAAVEENPPACHRVPLTTECHSNAVAHRGVALECGRGRVLELRAALKVVGNTCTRTATRGLGHSFCLSRLVQLMPIR